MLVRFREPGAWICGPELSRGKLESEDGIARSSTIREAKIANRLMRKRIICRALKAVSGGSTQGAMQRASTQTRHSKAMTTLKALTIWIKS